MPARYRPETILAQAGGAVDAETGAIVPPIHIATTFLRDPDNQYRRGFAYGRPDNATVRQTEAMLSALEGGAASLLLASGMAAATSLFLALPRPAHIVAPRVMYWGLRKWLVEDAPAHGLTASLVDGADLGAIAAATRPGETRLVWMETPANPLWTITDIKGAATAAHAAGAALAVDSTVATPILTRPLAEGADVVMHAATKYLNGHSDVVAGALSFARTEGLFERAAAVRASLGAILGPIEAALLLRGLRTLHLRVGAQCAAAMKIARHFAADPRVAEVLYPGLENHPGHAVAARQMHGGFGGMLSIRVRGGEEAAIATAAGVALWKRATSLGGVESLIEHRASVEGTASPCPPDLLRLSVGIEAAEDLIADLDRALAAAR
ncbi:MAG: PLP-dependent transferase [Hyphomicrobiaceae bacterium]|nr:PLP-dependent transferase [Hyphomicrobiaceae bacterium]